MAIADKQLLLSEVQRMLYDKITAADIDIVSSVLLEKLAMYDVERSLAEESDCDSEELISAYLNAKQIDGCSPKTIEHYRYQIGRLMDAIKIPLRSVTVHHIRAFMMAEKKRGISDVTLSGNRDAYCSFFHWLFREGLIESDPCGNLAPIRTRKEKKKAFSESEIEKIKGACESIRDKAIVAFLLSTGCRIEETCNLNMADIDFAKGQCKVLGKGNKERIVYINDVAALYLKEYAATRERNGPLFVGKGDVRLHPGGVRAMLNKTADRAGVENVHPHRFRRTLATNLIKRGMPIQEVALVLGHEDVNTTMKYIDYSEQDIKNSYRRYA